jgi:hypothetical protein
MSAGSRRETCRHAGIIDQPHTVSSGELSTTMREGTAAAASEQLGEGRCDQPSPPSPTASTSCRVRSCLVSIKMMDLVESSTRGASHTAAPCADAQRLFPAVPEQSLGLLVDHQALRKVAGEARSCPFAVGSRSALCGHSPVVVVRHAAREPKCLAVNLHLLSGEAESHLATFARLG